MLASWVTAEEVYGRDLGLRAFCEDRGVGYVLEIPCSFPLMLTSRRTVRADQAVKLGPPRAWNRASCGPGSKSRPDRGLGVGRYHQPPTPPAGAP